MGDIPENRYFSEALVGLESAPVTFRLAVTSITLSQTKTDPHLFDFSNSGPDGISAATPSLMLRRKV